MAETGSLIQQIKAPVSRIFRRFSIKRRIGAGTTTAGQFETDWQDLSRFVMNWGRFSWSVDTPRFGELYLDNAGLKVLNVEGTFNPNDNTDSFWNGYADMQRSLVRIEAGFIHETQAASGQWNRTEFPTSTTLWTGIINGDIALDGSSEVFLPLRSISQVFRDYPATDVTFGTSTGGISSGAWMTLLRDHTDGSSNFIFRPFIGTGAANDWNITAGGHHYVNLNSNSADGFQQKTCWDVLQRFAKAENRLAWVNPKGQFYWQDKTANASVDYEFHGLGSEAVNRTYGVQIKNIERYGKRLTGFYSRVSVQYLDDPLTSTSFISTGLALSINDTNSAWNLGHRTFQVDLSGWFNTASVAEAQSLAGALFSQVSSQVEEIDFRATFVPGIDLTDRMSVTYDATDFANNSSFWDVNDWAAAATATNDLIWDAERGDAIVLNSTNFMVLSVEHDLDRMESRFIGRQL